MCVSTVHVACSKLTRETYFMWQQCFLDSVGVCETISYVRELCIISNILSVLVPHLFYFTLFLDPLFVCMYIYVYIALFVYLSPPILSFSFSLPLSFSRSYFSIFPPSNVFHSFLHFSFTALFTLFRSRLPSTFAHFLSTDVSRSPLCITRFPNFDIHLQFQTEIPTVYPCHSSRWSCDFFSIFTPFCYFTKLSLYHFIKKHPPFEFHPTFPLNVWEDR